MGPVIPTKEHKEPITVTPDEIIYHRRLRVLEHAKGTGNVAETCRVFGISRTAFYRWQGRAERYGVEALMPKGRRRSQLPNATPTWVVEELLGMLRDTDAALPPTVRRRPGAKSRLGEGT